MPQISPLVEALTALAALGQRNVLGPVCCAICRVGLLRGLDLQNRRKMILLVLHSALNHGDLGLSMELGRRV